MWFLWPFVLLGVSIYSSVSFLEPFHSLRSSFSLSLQFHSLFLLLYNGYKFYSASRPAHVPWAPLLQPRHLRASCGCRSGCGVWVWPGLPGPVLWRHRPRVTQSAAHPGCAGRHHRAVDPGVHLGQVQTETKEKPQVEQKCISLYFHLVKLTFNCVKYISLFPLFNMTVMELNYWDIRQWKAMIK